MPWRSLLYFLLIELCVVNYANAQFTDASEWLNIYQGGTEGLYGNGISLHDFNRDGLDDITICTNGNGVKTYLNDGDSFIELNLFNFIEGDIKQPVWIDFDNDNDPDFFCTVYGGSCHLFRNDGFLQFSDITTAMNLPTATAKCFGAAWADYDLDGDLDVYVANYDFIMPAAISNWLLHNNGDGTFTEMASALGIDNDFRATFQPAWCDVNLDGYPDLFVINDKYHGNALYLNEGGIFTDVSESRNMNHAMESMCNSWCDFDHDLDFDVYVSNSTQGNKLLRNDGFFFTDIAVETGTEVNSVCWNALWLDVDHDLKKDLHVATNSPFFEGNQNKLFEATDASLWIDLSIPNDQRSVLSEAKGDINHDGFWDIVQVAEFPVNTACLLSNSTNHHYLKFSLQGSISNSDGIGAAVIYSIDGEQYLSTVFAGAGFLSQDSRYEILSLKDAVDVDQLEIHWPSGWIDYYSALMADSTYHFVEGQTYSVSLTADQDAICPGETATISVAGEGSWLWPDGSVGPSFLANQPGWYFVQATHEAGFIFEDSIYIEAKSMPEFDILVHGPYCVDDAGASVTLLADQSVVWYFDALVIPTHIVDSLQPGIYETIILATNGCQTHVDISIADVEPISMFLQTDTACYQGSVEVSWMISGGSPPYEIFWYNEDPQFMPPGAHEVNVVDSNGCGHHVTLHIEQYDSLYCVWSFDAVSSSLTAIPVGGNPPYNFLWENGEGAPQISLNENGVYTCLITDEAGCSIQAEYDYIQSSLLEIGHSLSCYPVPASDRLFVSSSANECVFLMDTHGNIVMSFVLIKGLNEISLQALEDGVYFLRTERYSYTIVKI